MPEPAAGGMRMSADDDDVADQQHELADPDIKALLISDSSGTA